jgi:CheY-like chemotaxis protein
MTTNSLAPPTELQPLSGTPRQRWMVDIARRAHLTNSEQLTIAPGATTEAAWTIAGADDYIRKPLEPARFVARVKAALRRAGS